MAHRSFTDLAEEKRVLILSTAAAEFAAHGYDNASLNRIIERCRMSKSSFYYYFDDKAELFGLVIDKGTARLVSELALPSPESLSEGDFWLNVESIFDRVVDVGLSQPWYFSIATIFYQVPPVAAPTGVSHALKAASGWVERALRTGQSIGAIRTDLPFDLLAESVFALLQVLDRWSARAAETSSANELHNAAHAQADFLRRMLAPNP